MKLSIYQIIKEEVNDFFSDWQIPEPSIADRYYQKYGIDTNTPNIKINAELIGYVNKQIDRPLNPPIPVYKNPRNLTGFKDNARGILMENGDLYLAQTFQAFHTNILDLLEDKGLVTFHQKYSYDLMYPVEFIAVERAANTNTFSQSSAYDKFPNYYIEIFDTANQKQPYKFTPHLQMDEEMESPLDPNYQISYVPQGYEYNILDETLDVPEVLQPLLQKSKQFKNPKFYMKSNDGGIYYHTTWNEILNKIKELKKYGWNDEKINKRMKEFDVYGAKKPQATTSLLNKTYNHPKDIPYNLYLYIRKNMGLISSDASDAVRWSRIIDTREEERYSNEEITIYRAVNRAYDEIREGDWVSTDENYVKNHMSRYLNNGHIISMEVNGKDVLKSPTGNYEEAIYAPMELSYPLDSYN